MSSYNQSHVEIDFLVSTKLNFAHVKFLLELTITPRVSNPGVELLRTSADMLSLVVEAIVLKQRLANSGTSLVWKVSHNAFRHAVSDGSMVNKGFEQIAQRD